MTTAPQHVLYYSCYFPVLANNLCWKWCHRRKGKHRAAHSFSFTPSLLISKLEVLIKCLLIKKWNNSWASFVQCFHCSGKNEIHMHTICIHKLWNVNYNFGDSTYELNVVSVAFKTRIVQYKNDKINAYNPKFNFLKFRTALSSK